MTLRSAISGIDAAHRAAPGNAPARIRADREQLTTVLRALAADLDALDRQLSDLEWDLTRSNSCRPQDGSAMVNGSALSAARAVLQARHLHLSAQLRDFVRQLSDLDDTLAALNGHEHWTPGRVGVCPHCGYPSLSSALCARCRSLAHD